MAGKTNRNNMVPCYLNWVIAAILSGLLFAGSASGQFMVQPVKLELTPRAGEVVITDLQLQNTAMGEDLTVEFGVADLIQLTNAEWEMVEPGSDFDTSKLSSCKDWIKLQHEAVRIKPLSLASISVTMKVPQNARGFYGALIHASAKGKLAVRGVAVVLRFLIPVLVQVEGWAPPARVGLTGVGMRLEQQPGKPAAAVVTLNAANNGESYSRLKGRVRVSAVSASNLRRITEADFLDCSIIPGVNLALESNIGRSLPSGKYRLEGALYVDGRRTKAIEKEIDFVGDKRLSRAAADAALDLTPPEVVVETVPGATRTAALRVTNASSEPVNVVTAVTIPPVLTGVGIPQVGLIGENLNCAPWVEITPKEFSIAANRSQNLRIITKMPNPTSAYAWYYAVLYLRASYVDGQNAGTRSAYICVSNKKVQAKPEARAWPLQLEHQSGSEYSIKSTFLNAGQMHFRPSCMVIVRMPDGGFVRSLTLSGEPEDVMLPLEPRIFSGVLDFAGMADGYYRLEATLRYGSQDVVSAAVPISVSRQADRVVVEIASSQDFEQKVGVKWR
jgi:hypothetical protein